MFFDGDGESAGDESLHPLETPDDGASESGHGAEERVSSFETSRSSFALQNSPSHGLDGDTDEKMSALYLGDRSDGQDPDKPPTPPPKSPRSSTSPLHLRSTSGKLFS